ncbi:MAG: hypothetical protein KGM49_04430 [Sphingomonadales bacterium]|nr:hypothetical protein [Sphingomonadales bacterium]
MASIAFAQGQGEFLMLRSCFDDSGTHADSRVVVWGGLIGNTEAFSVLEYLWEQFLREPAEGKPSIKKFSARDCRRGRGEFDGWEEGARDRARKIARDIIVKSQLVPVCYAVPLDDFNRIIRGRVRRAFGDANAIAFAACADTAMKLAKKRNEAMACVFDAGQETPFLTELLADNIKRAKDMSVPISHTFQAVADSYGLQAADTIATEHYWYTLNSIQTGSAEPEPHMRALLRDTDPFGYVMVRADMENLRDRYRKQFPLWRYFGRKR